MTKQGAARLLQHLLEEGYVEQVEEGEVDARRKPFSLTRRGMRVVELSVRVQERIEEAWVSEIGCVVGSLCAKHSSGWFRLGQIRTADCLRCGRPGDTRSAAELGRSTGSATSLAIASRKKASGAPGLE
jgi:hypothetical protein